MKFRTSEPSIWTGKFHEPLVRRTGAQKTSGRTLTAYGVNIDSGYGVLSVQHHTITWINTDLLSHLGNRGTYCFWSAAAAVVPTLFNFPGKPLKLISSNHTWLTYGCGKKFWHPFRWPWIKVTKLPKQNTIYLVPMIKWELLIQSLQNLEVYLPHHAFHLIKFWRNSAKIFFSQFFSENFKSVFPSRTFYLPYLRNGWSNWCETKRMWVNWMLRWLGYLWPWPWLWPWIIIKVKLYLGNGRPDCHGTKETGVDRMP